MLTSTARKLSKEKDGLIHRGSQSLLTDLALRLVLGGELLGRDPLDVAGLDDLLLLILHWQKNFL